MTYEIDSHALSIDCKGEKRCDDDDDDDDDDDRTVTVQHGLSHAYWIFNETESVALIIPQRNEVKTLLSTIFLANYCIHC
jgi:hypothetical protein